MLQPVADIRPLAPDAFNASRRAVLADKSYFASHPEVRSRLRQMIVGELGELEPALPADLPDGMRATFYILVEPRSREPNGWPRRLSRRLLIVLQPDGDADAQATLQDRGADLRSDGAPPLVKRKRPGPGRPKGAITERRSGKMSRPLKAAIDDLSALLNDYAFNCRIDGETIELKADPTSAAASSAWARQAAERLRHEFRHCKALRARVTRWAREQTGEER